MGDDCDWYFIVQRISKNSTHWYILWKHFTANETFDNKNKGKYRTFMLKLHPGNYCVGNNVMNNGSNNGNDRRRADQSAQQWSTKMSSQTKRSSSRAAVGPDERPGQHPPSGCCRLAPPAPLGCARTHSLCYSKRFLPPRSSNNDSLMSFQRGAVI